ncbi:unnamed protein product [Parajaminaea phylloscopi]
MFSMPRGVSDRQSSAQGYTDTVLDGMKNQKEQQAGIGSRPAKAKTRRAGGPRWSRDHPEQTGRFRFPLSLNLLPRLEDPSHNSARLLYAHFEPSNVLMRRVEPSLRAVRSTSRSAVCF